MRRRPPVALARAARVLGMRGLDLAYCGVLSGALYVRFGQGEFPCPLCMLQRYAMILSSLGAMWIVMQARRGTPDDRSLRAGTGVGAARGTDRLGHLHPADPAAHPSPGDPGYGSPMLGLHLYTWALITFFIVAVFVAVALILVPRGVATVWGPPAWAASDGC